jgi:hypothetical protein
MAMVIKFTVMWRRVLWYIITDVPEESAGSIFRVEIYLDGGGRTLL